MKAWTQEALVAQIGYEKTRLACYVSAIMGGSIPVVDT